LVTFVATDLDAPEMGRWTGLPKLITKLLAYHEAGRASRGQEREAALPAQLGYTDLAGQLRMALDQFSAARLFPFSWIAALVIGYILLIGPVDYFFLKSVVGRMAWTWFSMPLLGLVLVALGAGLAASSRSPLVHICQADVIDLDLATGTVRGQSWIHVYSSRTAALDLSVQMTAWRDTDSLHGDLGPAPRAAEVRTGQVLSWSGLPGRGLGGLDGRAAPQLFDGVSRLQMAGIRDPLARPAIDNVPFAAASTKSFADYWTRTMPTEGRGGPVGDDPAYARGLGSQSLADQACGLRLVV
jgi:hypothetical protein